MTRPNPNTPTPMCDRLREIGEWNPDWEPFYALDPSWTEKFMTAGVAPMLKGVLDPKTVEFIAIAIDASCTHMYGPGVRRHIRKALDLGATKEEITAVLQLASVLGIHAMSLGALEVFSARRAGTAAGIFFMGIPLGIGLSFLLAGTLGATHGWRDTFTMLGVIGVAIGVPALLLKDRRDSHGEAEQGAPFLRQLRNVVVSLRANPTVPLTIVGFALVHIAITGLSFAQLWLVRERGFDAAAISRQIGGLQIVFGVLGSVVGGVLSDRLARHIKGGHAGFLVLLVAICGPLMVAYRFVPPSSALFYVGMCAGFFLPLATYGPSLALIQGMTPKHMRSTVTGVAMLTINVLAIAIGNVAVGAVSDHMIAAGSTRALTTVLLATDFLVISAAIFFALAARGPKLSAVRPSVVIAH